MIPGGSPGPEPGDEIAAPDTPGFLEGFQDRVDPGETALDTFGQRRLACDHPVPVEQLQRLRVRALCRRGDRFEQRRHE